MSRPAGTCAPPALIVLPGLDGIGKRLHEFLRRIPAPLDARIIGYPPDRPMGYEELTRRVADSLPARQRYVLLGESFAGPIVARLATQSPAGLAGMVLVSSFVGSPYPALRRFGPVVSRVPIKGLPRWLRALTLWDSGTPCRAPRESERGTHGVSTEVLRRRVRALLEAPIPAHLERVRVPALVIQGTRDRLVPQNAVRGIIDALPRARLLRLDGPHLLLQTRPAQCAAAVVEFYEENWGSL